MCTCTFPDDWNDPDDWGGADGSSLSDERIVEIVRRSGRGSPQFRYLREALMTSSLGKLLKIGPRLILRDAESRGIFIPRPIPSSFYGEFPTLCFLAVDTSVDSFMERQVMQEGWSADGGSSLREFCKRKAIYGFVDQYRRYHRQEISTCEVALDDEYGDGEGDPHEAALVRRAPDPEQTAIERDSISRALTGMSEQTKAMLSLSAEGYTQKEIARILGLTEAAVNSRLRRLRRNPK